MTTTSDVHALVVAALTDYADRYDVEAIVADLIAEHGPAVEYDDEAFWAVVARHALPEPVEPDEQFRAGLTAAMAGAPLGQRATWTAPDESVTLTTYGASRVRHEWPQPAEVTIATPDGAERVIDGMGVSSWDELWALVQGAGTDYADDADALLDQLVGAHRGLDRAEQAASRARAQRDQLIREASRAGVTAYRITQRLRAAGYPIAESTIGRVLR